MHHLHHKSVTDLIIQMLLRHDYATKAMLLSKGHAIYDKHASVEVNHLPKTMRGREHEFIEGVKGAIGKTIKPYLAPYSPRQQKKIWKRVVATVLCTLLLKMEDRDKGEKAKRLEFVNVRPSRGLLPM